MLKIARPANAFAKLLRELQRRRRKLPGKPWRSPPCPPKQSTSTNQSDAGNQCGECSGDGK